MKYTIDLHNHSIASGHAYNTFQEIVTSAKAKGITTFALTDHGPAMPDGPHPYYFGNIPTLPKEKDGVRILRGIESNIISEKGKLDLHDEYRNRLDIVLAGLHVGCGLKEAGKKKNSKAVIRAIESGKVDIIVHPGNIQWPLNYEDVVIAAKENDVALELNNSSFYGSRKGSEKNCQKILDLAVKHEIFISLGSDSHYADNIGELGIVTDMIEKASYPADKLLNSSETVLDAFLAKRH